MMNPISVKNWRVDCTLVVQWRLGAWLPLLGFLTTMSLREPLHS